MVYFPIEPFRDLKDVKDDEFWTVRNCFAHMIYENNIDIDLFKKFIIRGGVAGDVDWGVEKWNIYSEEDHGIEAYYDGYLFFLGEEELGRDRGVGESQVILSKDEIKPYIHHIVDWYKKRIDSNVEELIKLAKENGFY
ncbi:hypothetical protein EXE30_06605 [Acinetobacter halotolerans]|uniref:CDI immunity protein domain-containing protein n=1 Tax=Acinetobacter halotolerans TaxID=1752076 RepID=A0A4Q6XCD1_9GAMM|nr:hypothetical protein [Acinetobacter halotolerans]RZF53640.1 hypothetical protein EXE30_06605 [Acinetobacter halotolerans]